MFLGIPLNSQKREVTLSLQEELVFEEIGKLDTYHSNRDDLVYSCHHLHMDRDSLSRKKSKV